ncbi:CobW-like GTP-binding protein [Pseudomonas stutzeri]|uniref:CobW family GTP-binding protein n=1 Tax=Stutzerimonas stutzeri TaxID=316 RepID=UPI000C9B8CD6|nr:CobW-like GTP-binding protein [Stutzerimonas stutzeri]MCQ4280510.1 CobW-like GTP-binding protein [Stutzerimonas stutzeri]PNF71549.1 cobalamin biosynthesis protein CobW [Stutzerimonas stutzeri]|tara:strand:+ start:13888 stop:14853 length:966 start_codon:yes stop_codon:yes gene_type:complete
MLSNIPTHLISGSLGAGKTSLIRALLAQRPASERWAVLINEFGQIGLDAALLSTDDSGVSLTEVAGGCLCCVNGVPFQVGLSRLLRKAKPDRLFIEPSGLGHPAELLDQLTRAPWHGVLAVQPCVAVIDGPGLLQGEPLPESQRQSLNHCGLLVINKSEGLSQTERHSIKTLLPPIPVRWTQHGQLPLRELPGIDQHAGHVETAPSSLPSSAASLGHVWLDPRQPLCQSQGSADGWSIGWRWHPSQRFDLERVKGWLESMDWRRAKLVMLGPQGWQSLNALNGQTLAFGPSEWRKDSRLELIFAEPQDEQHLNDALVACRL